MKRRVVLLTEIISPYRIPLFNALARRPEVSLHVIFLAETDPTLRQWEVYKHEIEFSYEVLPSWRRRIGRHNLLLNRRVNAALRKAEPEIIVCGGYNYPASWQALVWARVHQVPFLLWSESNLQDLRPRSFLIEFLKREFLQACSGFAVPGKSARAYLRALHVADDRIFTAPNAVGNDFFSGKAACARQNWASCRRKLNLPERYFLFAGRLVPEKGVFDLLAAYAKLEPQLREQMGLVLAGDGPVRRQLEEEARSISPGKVCFTGFLQREDLAKCYALGEMLILPTHTDTWGLVVNEAMACGLPVILSEMAGCGPDLVKVGWNGFLIPVADTGRLATVMQSIASQPDLRATMGANSTTLIANYSPEAWAEGLCEAARVFGRGM